MRPIHGKDCVVRIRISGIYYPLLCATDFDLSVAQETREATAPGTGTWRRYRAVGMSQWNINLSGLTKVDNSDGQVSWFYIFQEQVRGSVQSLELEFMDEDGNKQYLYGDVLIPDMNLNASVNDFVGGIISFQGDGVPELVSDSSVESITSILCEVQATIPAILAEGETSLTVSALTASGARVLWITREGIGYTIVTGTPVGLQCTVDYGTGEISFPAPANEGGEGIEIGWQIAP